VPVRAIVVRTVVLVRPREQHLHLLDAVQRCQPGVLSAWRLVLAPGRRRRVASRASELRVRAARPRRCPGRPALPKLCAYDTRGARPCSLEL
jgi:hypothetical protein